MRRIRGLLWPALCWLPALWYGSLSVGASADMPPARRQPVLIQSIRARPDQNATALDIRLQGVTVPVLAQEPRRLILRLPNALPGPQLAANMASGGLVARMALERFPASRAGVEVRLELSAPALGELVPGPDPRTLRVRITPTDRTVPATSVRLAGAGLYDINASQSDVIELLRTLARESGLSIVIVGAVNTKLTLDLHQVPAEKAIDLLTRAAGLVYRQDGATYMVGAAKDLERAYPQPEPARPPAPVLVEKIYHCQHITASDLLTTLEKIFGKDQLTVTLGAAASSPRLDEATTATVTGIQATPLKSGVSTESGSGSRDLVLYGEQSVVARALLLAAQLDNRRAQVRISVRITDISLDALRELGVQWNWSSYIARETTPSWINFGTFTHDPVSIEAKLSALEQNDRAKLLAAPTLSLLDGERGFILIGERLLYPKLIGYTQAQTPIFDKEEERVGIYLQVAVQTDGNGEITLTIYPQVSVVTGFLTVNGASYPQISTREQQTTVRVRDGEKIVVGGLIRNEEINNIQRVPLLSRIPLFGELFTYRKKTRHQSEVIIMITPQILKD